MRDIAETLMPAGATLVLFYLFVALGMTTGLAAMWAIAGSIWFCVGYVAALDYYDVT